MVAGDIGAAVARIHHNCPQTRICFVVLLEHFPDYESIVFETLDKIAGGTNFITAYFFIHFFYLFMQGTT